MGPLAHAQFAQFASKVNAIARAPAGRTLATIVIVRRFVTLGVLVAACAPVGGGEGPGKKPDANMSMPVDAAGSGSGSGADAGTDANLITPSWFLDNWETKYCAAAFACRNNYPNNTGQTFTEAFGQNINDCHAILASYDMPATVEMQVTQGVITFSPASAQTCISSFAYTCNNQDFWNNGPTYTGNSCPTALVGTVQNGGNCLNSWQCQNWTSYCDAGTHKCTAI